MHCLHTLGDKSASHTPFLRKSVLAIAMLRPVAATVGLRFVAAAARKKTPTILMISLCNPWAVDQEGRSH